MTKYMTEESMGRKRLFTKEEVFRAIHSFILENDMAPTVEELRDKLGAGSTRTILRYLRWLEEDGDIRRWPGARGIELARAPEGTGATTTVPLVGEVSAGPLMLAEENIEMRVRLPRAFTKPKGATFFLLRVRGDSMNRAELDGARIEEGDLVLTRQQSTAESGDIVVALVDGDATIKRLTKEKEYWILQPESDNPDHEPIIVDRDFTIQGIAHKVLKRGSDLLRER